MCTTQPEIALKEPENANVKRNTKNRIAIPAVSVILGTPNANRVSASKTELEVTIAKPMEVHVPAGPTSVENFVTSALKDFMTFRTA